MKLQIVATERSTGIEHQVHSVHMDDDMNIVAISLERQAYNVVWEPAHEFDLQMEVID